MAMEKNDFYSVVLKKKIKIPDMNIKSVVRSGRNFLVGKYTAKSPKTGLQKEYEAWKVVAKAKK